MFFKFLVVLFKLCYTKNVEGSCGDMDFGERLKLIHETQNISQGQLASQMGMAPENIQRYKATGATPKADKVIAFAEALRVPSFLLEPSNWGYVPFETKGDAIALVTESVKRGFISLAYDKKQHLIIEGGTGVLSLLSKERNFAFDDEEINQAITYWEEGWRIDYLAHRDLVSNENSQFVLDDLDRKQIRLAIQNNQPIK